VKAVLLAGGSGTRLYPSTLAVSKHLLPVYSKPMIYYPLSTLLLTGIRDISIVATPADLPLYQALLGDGTRIGVSLTYVAQASPKGVAHGLLSAGPAVQGHRVALILGDNLFFGGRFEQELSGIADSPGTTILASRVDDPRRYGVVELDRDGRPVSIAEKPEQPRSGHAVPGLYFYDRDVIDVIGTIRPSDRGEYEITDVNAAYLREGRLKVRVLDAEVSWFDLGTHSSLLTAANHISALEVESGGLIGSIEVAAFRMGFLDAEGVGRALHPIRHSDYAKRVVRECQGGNT
jgi:glucose-1-phosphate thymidylyltransferase